jgi:hypothetical protein
MTQDEIIDMARFAGIRIDSFGFQGGFIEEFKAFAKLVAAKEQDRCCAIVFAQCGSDNVAQRTVDSIRGKA